MHAETHICPVVRSKGWRGPAAIHGVMAASRPGRHGVVAACLRGLRRRPFHRRMAIPQTRERILADHDPQQPRIVRAVRHRRCRTRADIVAARAANPASTSTNRPVGAGAEPGASRHAGSGIARNTGEYHRFPRAPTEPEPGLRSRLTLPVKQRATRYRYSWADRAGATATEIGSRHVSARLRPSDWLLERLHAPPRTPARGLRKPGPPIDRSCGAIVSG